MFKIKPIALSALLALPALQDANAENIILTTPQNFQVVAMSPNCKWACGVFIGAGDTSASFRWNLETGKVEILGAGEESMAWGVANDGTVSGNFANKGLLPYGNPIQSVGVARGTQWEALEIPADADPDSEGLGYAITPDGRGVTGTVLMNGIYTPVIWRDGKVYKVFKTAKHSMSYCISPDGEAVAGWSYGPVHSNRAATYWAPDGTMKMLLDSPQWSETMFNSVNAFSPDGKTLLYWGGWDPVTDENGNYVENYLYALYDIESDTRTKIKAPSVSSSMTFYSMTNSGLLVGSDQDRGFLYKDGEGIYIDDYLQQRGVDLTNYSDFYVSESGNTQLPIFRIQNVSDDANTFIFIFYDKEGVLRSMCLKIDRDLTAVPPIAFTAERMKGINTVALNWMAPLEAKGIRGYNIYRDDKKLNGLLPLNRLYYYDANLAEGTYKYKVAAVNAAGIETFAEEMEVTVANEGLAAPMALFARQKGINDAQLSWVAPENNMTHIRYYNPESTALEALNVYMPVEMEVAVKYDKNDLAQYAGAKVKEVSFIPMGEQDAWTLVFYTRNADGSLVELAKQTVSQTLNYRVPNTVVLDTPLSLPDGDLYMALRVMVSSEGGGVIAADNFVSRPGYSDLLRQTSEADFYSAFESSAANATSVTYNSWALDMVLEVPGYDAANDVVDHYNIYVGDEKAAEATTTEALLTALEDGTHRIGVEAVYKNGTPSTIVERTLDIVAKHEAVENVNVDVAVNDGNATVNATWQEPLNRDNLTLRYDEDETPTYGVNGVNNAVIIGCEYTADMLKGYKGYKLESVAFYPLSDAIYTIGVYEDGKILSEQEVSDFTPNAWCTVVLEDDIFIKENADYRVVVDAFDAEPGKPIFGLGSHIAFPYRSDLYSVDGGSTYNSYMYETGRNAGWLMKTNLVEVDGTTVKPEGYDVLIDGLVKNDTHLSEPKFSFEMGAVDNNLHSIIVNTYYEGLTDAVKGARSTFHINTSGIDGTVIATIDLHQYADKLVAEGDGVKAIMLVGTDGKVIARAEGNTLDIVDIAGGIYIVKIEATGASVTRKISIVK